MRLTLALLTLLTMPTSHAGCGKALEPFAILSSFENGIVTAEALEKSGTLFEVPWMIEQIFKNPKDLENPILSNFGEKLVFKMANAIFGKPELVSQVYVLANTSPNVQCLTFFSRLDTILWQAQGASSLTEGLSRISGRTKEALNPKVVGAALDIHFKEPLLFSPEASTSPLSPLFEVSTISPKSAAQLEIGFVIENASSLGFGPKTQLRLGVYATTKEHPVQQGHHFLRGYQFRVTHVESGKTVTVQTGKPEVRSLQHRAKALVLASDLGLTKFTGTLKIERISQP